MGLAACGGDGGSDEDEIADVLKRAVTTKDVKVECEETVTDDLVDRIYGDVAQCRRAERPEPDDDEPEDVRVSDVRVDGDSATARVRFVGGDTDGARGVLELRKQNGDWRVDDLGTDLLRSTVDRGLSSGVQDNEALGRPAVRRCVRNEFADLADAELRRVAYAAISERAGSEAVLARVIGPCLSIAGSGRSGGTSFLRENFERGVRRNLRGRGLSRSRIDCIVRRLRSSVSDRQIIAATRGGRASGLVQRAGRAAGRACT